MQRTYLPIAPMSALRRHRVHEPFDTRFRSAARLLQSAWRDAKGLPVGSYTRPSGATFRLGSIISDKAGEAGRNFLVPEIATLQAFTVESLGHHLETVWPLLRREPHPVPTGSRRSSGQTVSR